MEKIKILHLITHLGVGGAQDNTLLTVKGHSRQRYEVHLAAGEDYVDWVPRGERYADAFFRFPDLQRSIRPLADLRALRQITKHLREQRYQIVHTHSAKAGTVGRLAAYWANVPVTIHTFHSFGWQVTNTVHAKPWRVLASGIKRRILIQVERLAATCSDALITVSELNRLEAIRLNLGPDGKFTTIYSGIDLNRFNSETDKEIVCRRLGLNPAEPIIGTVGRLSVQKAPLDFIAAAKLALSERPDAQFIMVGDGPLTVDVSQAIGDEKRIRTYGFRDDVPEVLSVLDVFVLSSLWEGLGRALTEAMVMARPVAATAVDGVPELVDHEETGLLSPPGNPAQLARNVLWLLNHPQEAYKMGVCARRRVVPAFSVERMVRQIEALYEGQLLASNAGGRGYRPLWSR